MSGLIIPETPFDLCERQRIEIRVGKHGETQETVLAWIHEGLGVHAMVSHPERFVISHLPSGMSLATAGAVFDSQEKAVRAMLEINAVQIKVQQGARPQEEWDAVATICLKHGCTFKTKEMIQRFSLAPWGERHYE